MGVRKSGKSMAIWMAADDVTAPVAGDEQAFVTGVSWSSRANISNTTAAGDSGAQKAGGIPDASMRITARIDATDSTQDPFLTAHNDQAARQFKFVWDDTSGASDIGCDFIAIVSEYGQSAQHTSPLDKSIGLEIIGTVTEDRTALP